MTLYIDARRSLENLYRFVDYLLAINNEQPKLVSSAERTIVEKLKQYIQSHIDRPLTRKELSDFIYLSPDHITHLFREKTGISLIEYINTLKMEKAAALLAETNMPVGLISSRVGFTSFSYFSKMFKKKTGLSPVEYRKKTRVIADAILMPSFDFDIQAGVHVFAFVQIDGISQVDRTAGFGDG